MAASIRIQNLQWVVGAAAAFGCAVLGGMQVAHNVTELGRTHRAVADATRFGLILAAADAVSAERAPSNAAMDPYADPSANRIAALAASRALTDRRLSEARAAGGDGAGGPVAAFVTVDRRLAQARAKVDAVTLKPAAERSGPLIAEAIIAMFAVADETAVLRGEFGRRLVSAAPEAGTEVLLQADASALREEAGRLGSYAVMKLTGGLTAEEARAAAGRSEEWIRRLWRTLSVFGKNYATDPDVGRALVDVETAYFGHSLPFAQHVLAEPALRGSAADFTGRYVPGLVAPTMLKDDLGQLTLRKIEGARQAAIIATLISAGITAAVLLTLLWLGLTLRKRLFRPLIAVRGQILALSDGQLDDPAPVARCGPEIDEMFAGLAVLRAELRRKLVLERARRRTTRNLKILAETDALTGLLNRRAVAAQVPLTIDTAERAEQPIGVILADIDHFKLVNDLHGHAVGDVVLRRVAAALKSLIRSGDMIARYGGEEFLIVVPGCDEAATFALAERMRHHLASGTGERDAGPAVTASFGVACRPPGAGCDWEALVARADSALYRAKRLGRNRVCDEGRMTPLTSEPLAQSA